MAAGKLIVAKALGGEQAVLLDEVVPAEAFEFEAPLNILEG